jgi:nucleoside transporter
MMFLEYLIWGTWFVDMGNYMSKHLLSASDPGKFATLGEIGGAYGNAWFGAIISPFFIGMIADKYFSAQKVNGVLHLFGGALLYYISTLTDVSTFSWMILLYSVLYMPTIGLTNSIAFHQSTDSAKDFPLLRVLGTVAWITANILVDLTGWVGTSYIFLIPAIYSVVFGLYSFTLPDTPPNPKSNTNIFDGLVLFKDRSYAIFFIGSVLLCIPLGFYYAHAKGFLIESGKINQDTVGTIMAVLGQGSEVLFMLALPFFLKRWGVRNILLVGMGAWAIRYLLFKFGLDSGAWMLYLGVALHGICYDFFFATGQIYTDQKAPESIRNAAQGLITFATYGVGLTIGSRLSGIIGDMYSTKVGDITTHDWGNIWLIPAGIAAVILVIFLLLFRESKIQKA